MWIQKVGGGGIRAMAYSPDGATLYTVDTSGWLTAWDVASRTGRRIVSDRRLAFTSRRLYALADGKRLALDAREPTLWDVDTKRALTGTEPAQRLEWEPTVVRPDGRMFGYYYDRPAIGGWNLSTGIPERERVLSDSDIPLRDFDLSSDEKLALVTTQAGNCVLYEWGEKLSPLSPVRMATAWLSQARFSPDGSAIAVAVGSSWTIGLWDVAARRPRVEQVLCMMDRRFALNPVFPVFAAINRSNVLAVWSLETGEQLRALDFELGRRVRCVCFSPDGLTCAVGGSNKQFAVFDVDL